MRLRISTIVEWITAIAGIITIVPYFIWSTYRNGLFWGERIGTIPLVLMVTGIMISLYLLNMGIGVSKRIMYISILMIVVFCFSIPISGAGIRIFPSMIMTYLIIAIFVLLPNDNKYRIFEKFRFLFAASLIPSIIIWAVLQLGINLPAGRITPMQEGYIINGYSYIWYPLSVFTDVGGAFPRFCGIYNEPGIVGTVGALLLVASNMKLKIDWKNIVILIGGILSLSLAFYLTVGIYIFFTIMRRGARWGICAAVTFLLIYGVFMSLEFSESNPVSSKLNIIQSRLVIKDGKLAGDNRTSPEFEAIFRNFMAAGGKRLWFGNGEGSSQNLGVDVCSYQNLIYDFGVIGFLLLMGWLVSGYWSQYIKKLNSSCMVLLTIYLINIYQRPYVFQLYYMIILFGGGAFLNFNEQNETRSKRPKAGVLA